MLLLESVLEHAQGSFGCALLTGLVVLNPKPQTLYTVNSNQAKARRF